MAGRKSKRIDKALKAALSEEIRKRKDPDPHWSPEDQIRPEDPVEAAPLVPISTPAPAGTLGRPTAPSLTLRGGDAIDDGKAPPPYDAELDRLSPEYLEEFCSGLSHLDPDSWRYYLPVFIGYAYSNASNPRSMAIDSFLFSLRPPEREPPRFQPLSAQERAEIVFILEKLAFEASSAWKEPAITALEEYWAPGALYR